MLIAPKPAEPERVNVMGVGVLFAPITRQMMRRARRAALAALDRPEDGREAAPVAEQLEELGDELSHALLIEGILDWGDEVIVRVEEDGETVDRSLSCTPENKALMLSDPVFFDAFDAAYVMPFAARERAKNGLAGSPDGTGTRATPAKDIAKPPVPETTAAKRGAKRVPTASTRSTTKRSRSPSRR